MPQGMQTTMTELRECKKCGATKPLDEFVSNSTCRGGRGHSCKECVKEWQRRYGLSHRDARRRHNAAWRAAHPEASSECQRRYREKHAAELAEKGRIRRQEERERIRARSIMNHAIRDGHLSRGVCERCGGGEHIEGHHADYSRPLEVTWLCAKCHKIEHRHAPDAVAA